MAIGDLSPPGSSRARVPKRRDPDFLLLLHTVRPNENGARSAWHDTRAGKDDWILDRPQPRSSAGHRHRRAVKVPVRGGRIKVFVGRRSAGTWLLQTAEKQPGAVIRPGGLGPLRAIDWASDRRGGRGVQDRKH